MAPGSGVTVCQTYEMVWGWASPGDTVTVTLSNGGSKGFGANRANGIGHFWTPLYTSTGQLADAAGGDTVRVYVNGALDTTVALATITGSVNPATDVVSGTITDTSLTFPISVTVAMAESGIDEPNPLDPTIVTSTDGSGNYSANFSSLWDIGEFYNARVSYSASGHGVHRHFYSANTFAAYETRNAAFGFTPPGNPVTATLYTSDGVTVKETRSGTTWNVNTLFYWFPFNADMEPGDVVKVETGGAPMTTTVAGITATVDLDNDVISGVGPANSRLRVGVTHLMGDYINYFLVVTDTNGSGLYTAEFSGTVDVLRYDDIDIWYADSNGYLTLVDPVAPLIIVDQAYNGVGGEAGASNLNITVTLQTSGGITYTRNLTSGITGGSWRDVQFDDGSGGVVDIAAGDRVTVTTDNWSDGLQVVSLSVSPDRAQDRITGDAPANPRMPVWGRHRWDGLYQRFRATASAASPYTVTLGDRFDLRYGDSGQVQHPTADDHLNAAGYQLPYLSVNESGDGLDGAAPGPDWPVTLTLKSNAGSVKATAVVTSSSNRGGLGWTNFYTGGQQASIDPGDRVEVSAAGWNETVTVLSPTISVDADPATGLISGTAPANSLVQVGIWNGSQWAEKPVPTDGNGRFIADMSDRITFKRSDYIVVHYSDSNYNELGAEYRQKYVRVNQTHDWIDGRVTPGATVYFTVTNDSTVKGTNSATAASDGWFNNDANCDVLGGDTVQVTSSDGFATSIAVVTMTGSVDPVANTVSGVVWGVSSADAEVNLGRQRPAGDQWTGKTVDGAIGSGGAYTIALTGFSSPFDTGILSSDQVEVFYINPDGNRVGISRRALRLGVVYGSGRVEGESTPGATVAVTLTNNVGNPKDFITATVDGAGEFNRNFITDVVPTDRATAVRDNITATVEVITITVQVDATTDTISGTGPANTTLRLHVYDKCCTNATTDSNGNYNQVYDQDIVSGDRGRVEYYYDDGHWVGREFDVGPLYSVYLPIILKSY